MSTRTSQVRFSNADVVLAGAFAALMVAHPANATATTNDRFEAQAVPAPKLASEDWVAVQLKKIGSLPQNWDGYGADPISHSVLTTMKSHLPSLLQPGVAAGSLVPGADGSLQAEWHLERVSFAFLVEEGDIISAWVRPFGGAEIERFGLEARELFQSAVRSYLV